MTTQNLIFLLVGAVAVFAALAAFGIAYRQGSQDDAWKDGLERDARKADKGVPAGIATARAATEASPVLVEQVTEPVVEAPEPAPAVRTEVVRHVVELSPMEAGVSRRMFFTRALAGSFFGLIGIFGLASFAFAWPRVKGGFGSDVDAGSVDELKAKIFQADGSITPVFWPEAKSWIVPISAGALAGSQFADASVATDDLMALFQKCVHLGCRVPWCQSSQGFECPCHGSKYNAAGEYEFGPAPRNLDRFVVEDQSGRFIIKTGQVIQSERAVVKSSKYPQGPSCIGG